MQMLPKSRIQCECEKKTPLLYMLYIFAGLDKRSYYDPHLKKC